jgi:hypothetical protein
LLHVTGWPVQGSVQVEPHQSAGHAVAGVQHVPGSAFEHCCPLAQFVEQSSVAFVQGSKTEPQKLAGQVIGVQHSFVSTPASPHSWPLAHVVLQLITVPLHGSV